MPILVLEMVTLARAAQRIKSTPGAPGGGSAGRPDLVKFRLTTLPVPTLQRRPRSAPTSPSEYNAMNPHTIAPAKHQPAW